MIEIEKFDRDFFCDKDKDKLFKELSRLKKENCVFRGISKKEQFLPSLMRKELQKVEIELLEQLEMKGQFLHNNSNYMDFLTSAQHYGLPTRLLDFSYNPYVALFFALYKENAEEEFYNIIYCSLTENIVFKNLPKIIRINNSNANSFSSDLRDAYSAINEIGDSDSSLRNYLYSAVYNLTYKGENLESDENINKIKKEDLRNKLIFLRAKNANLRIAMQEGLFLFSNTTNEKEYLKILQKNTKLLCIHKNLRKDLLDELKIMGITEEKIMPDLQSLCFAIIEQFTKKLSVKKWIYYMFNLINPGKRAERDIPNVYYVWKNRDGLCRRYQRVLNLHALSWDYQLQKVTAKTAMQKQETLEYLTKNVSATSQEIAELLSVGLSWTKGLLRELVVEEVVLAEGADRNRTYRLKRWFLS